LLEISYRLVENVVGWDFSDKTLLIKQTLKTLVKIVNSLLNNIIVCSLHLDRLKLSL